MSDQMHGHPRHSSNQLHQKNFPSRQTRKKKKLQRSVSPLLRKRAHRQRKRFPSGKCAGGDKQNLMKLRIAGDYRKHPQRASHNGHEKPFRIKTWAPQLSRQLSPNHRMKQSPHRSTIPEIANGFLARKSRTFPNVFQHTHPKRNLAPTMETRRQIAEKPNHRERLALNQKEKQSPRREEDPREESKQAFSLVPIVCISLILAFFSSVVVFLSWETHLICAQQIVLLAGSRAQYILGLRRCLCLCYCLRRFFWISRLPKFLPLLRLNLFFTLPYPLVVIHCTSLDISY